MQDLDEVYYDKYHVNRQIPNVPSNNITKLNDGIDVQPKESKSKSHFYFSIAKSAVRIMGFYFFN